MMRKCWVVRRLVTRVLITYPTATNLIETDVVTNSCLLLYFESAPVRSPSANDNQPVAAIELVRRRWRCGVAKAKLVGIFMSGVCPALLQAAARQSPLPAPFTAVNSVRKDALRRRDGSRRETPALPLKDEGSSRTSETEQFCSADARFK